MRRSHLFALAGAVVLITALVLVLDSGPVETAEVAPAPELPTTPPTTFALVLAAEIPGGEELADLEEVLTEAATAASSTTTSTSITTTTVAPAEKPSNSNSGSGSSGSSSTSSTSSTTTTQPETPPVTTPAGFRSDYEAEFRSRINSIRSSNGLGGLSSNGSLNSRARDWAKNMADSNKLKHSNIGNLVPPWQGAGENVGKGGSVGSIFNSLAGSSAHLSNMLGDYTDVGVGVWVDSSGTLWTVHVFTR